MRWSDHRSFLRAVRHNFRRELLIHIFIIVTECPSTHIVSSDHRLVLICHRNVFGKFLSWTHFSGAPRAAYFGYRPRASHCVKHQEVELARMLVLNLFLKQS